MAPIWEEVAINKTSKYGSTVHFGDVDCVANGDVCQKNGVKMFPHVAAYVTETLSMSTNINTPLATSMDKNLTTIKTLLNVSLNRYQNLLKILP